MENLDCGYVLGRRLSHIVDKLLWSNSEKHTCPKPISYVILVEFGVRIHLGDERIAF